MSRLVIFDTGDTAQVASVYLRQHSDHEVVAYVVDRKFLVEPQFLGRPVIAWDELPTRFPPGNVLLLGPLSVRRMNQFRKERFLEGKALGYEFASFVHPSVERLEVSMGENCFVFGGVIIEPFARLGDNVIVWSNAHIGHHAMIENHCFIGPGAGVGGYCVIGEGSFLGPKADVAPRVRVGRDCFLAQRSAISEDAADGGVYIRASSLRSDIHSSRMARLL